MQRIVYQKSIYFICLTTPLFATSPSSNSMSIGLGMESGFFGFSYQKKHQEPQYISSFGFGVEGLAYHFKWAPAPKHSFSPYLSPGFLYSPWEFLLFSEQSLIVNLMGGFHFWNPSEGGFYFSAGAGVSQVVLGIAEGNETTFPTFDFRLGWNY